MAFNWIWLSRLGFSAIPRLFQLNRTPTLALGPYYQPNCAFKELGVSISMHISLRQPPWHVFKAQRHMDR